VFVPVVADKVHAAFINKELGSIESGSKLVNRERLFVYDPSGVQLELTFEVGGEGAEQPDMSPGRKYVAGASFFDKTTYPKLA
jgi:hypothetical protein